MFIYTIANMLYTSSIMLYFISLKHNHVTTYHNKHDGFICTHTIGEEVMEEETPENNVTPEHQLVAPTLETQGQFLSISLSFAKCI